MKLVIKNTDVPKCLTFIKDMDLSGVDSINRSKITRFLTEQLQEIAENEKQIVEDAKGNREKMSEWLKEFFEQKITIEGANFENGLAVIKQTIKEYVAEGSKRKFSGDDADALLVLYEALNVEEEE